MAIAAWCLPNHYVPWKSFHSELGMAVAFIVGCCWALWRLRDAPACVPRLALVAVAATLIPLAQLGTGQLSFAGDFWIVVLYLLGFALALTIGFQMAAVEGLDRLLGFSCWTLLAAGIVCVGLALYQWLQLDYLWIFVEPMPPTGRAFANLGQPNHLATLLVLSLCATAWQYERGRLGGVVALLLIGYLGFGLAMTQARVGLLSATLVSAWLLFHRRHFGSRLGARSLLGAYALLLGCTILWSWLTNQADVPAGRSISEVTAAGHRITHWVSMLDAIGRQPWIGYGWNQVAQAQALVAVDHPATGEIIEHSHNLMLDLLIWNGIPIGGLLIIALSLWWYRAVSEAREPAVIVAIGAIGAVFIHALLEFAMEYSYFMLPTALLMGAVTASLTPAAAIQLPRVALLGLAGITTTLVALVALDYLALEEETRAVRFEEARIGIDKPRAPPPEIRLLTQLEGFLLFARAREREGMTSNELDEMRRVVSRYPYSFSILRYAAASAINGHPEVARKALEPICRTHPLSACEQAQRFWEALGEGQPHIAAIRWP